MRNNHPKAIRTTACFLIFVMLLSALTAFTISAETPEITRTEKLYDFNDASAFSFSWDANNTRHYASVLGGDAQAVSRFDSGTNKHSIDVAETPNGTKGLLWNKPAAGTWLEFQNAAYLAKLGADFTVSYDVYFNSIGDDFAFRFASLGGGYTYGHLFIMNGSSVYAMSGWDAVGDPIFTASTGTWYNFAIRYELGEGTATFLVDGVEKYTQRVITGTNVISSMRIQTGGTASFYMDNIRLTPGTAYWSYSFGNDTVATYQNTSGAPAHCAVQVFNNGVYSGIRPFTLGSEGGENVLKFDNTTVSTSEIGKQRIELIRNNTFMNNLMATGQMVLEYQIKFDKLGTGEGKESIIRLAGHSAFKTVNGFALVGANIYRFNGWDIDTETGKLFTVESDKWYRFSFAYDKGAQTINMYIDGQHVGTAFNMTPADSLGTVITIQPNSLDSSKVDGRCQFRFKEIVAYPGTFTATQTDPLLDTLTFRGVQKSAVNEGSLNLRFVASGSTLDAKNAGFHVIATNFGNADYSADSTTVYSSILATSSDGQTLKKVEASDFGSKYVTTLTIKGIPAETQVVFLVTPYVIDANGDEILGEAFTVTLGADGKIS